LYISLFIFINLNLKLLEYNF